MSFELSFFIACFVNKRHAVRKRLFKRGCLHPTYITCCTIPYFFFHVLHDVARCFARFRNVRVVYGPKSWTPKNGCVFYSPPIGWAQRVKLKKFRFLTKESRQKHLSPSDMDSSCLAAISSTFSTPCKRNLGPIL